MKTFLLVFFLFSIQLVCSQNYKTIDSLVNTYPAKFKSIESFADRIRTDFKTDLERTRAVYYWLANNITYDYKSLRKKKKIKKIRAKSKRDYELKLYQYNQRVAEKTLRKKSAMCEGYAQLLNYTLSELDIISVVVPGYAKQFANEIGRKRSNSNHAWNAVKIDQKWYLMDVTWSTGNSIYNDNFFNFSDTYFMINPEKLILSHFPDDSQWQLLEKPVSRVDYFNFPAVYEAYHKSELKLEDRTVGYIITKTDSMINLYFTKIDTKKNYYYSFDGISKSDKIKFIELDGLYKVSIPYSFKRRRNLAISDGQMVLMKFKIKLLKD
ncbi:transglutaminase domain-containing protein [Winogradskyella pacifica]|uniref:transglutaminase domain-containing protein n=1 Tax=Winogradskyella pacifica TaxID=664642 RepID=UPI0015C74A2A|nr:transglutaminase domain-containing protein [Winogradskyella pacifica]